MGIQKITITWTNAANNPAVFNLTRVVYAYSFVKSDKIFYVGKSAGETSSARTRWNDHTNRWMHDTLTDRQGHGRHIVRVGDISMEDGKRFSAKLLGQIEGVLIEVLNPEYNDRTPDSNRDGLLIENVGNWPGPRFIFVARNGMIYWGPSVASIVKMLEQAAE
jgi:hypothetical protein